MLPMQRRRTSTEGHCVPGVAHYCSRAFFVSVVTQPSAGLDFARVGISGVRLEALFEAVPLAIAIFDAELRLVNANARYRELTGVASSVPARSLDLRRVPERARRPHRSDRLALRGITERRRAVRIPFQHRGGRRLIETTFAPLTDEAGRPRDSLRRQRRQRTRRAARDAQPQRRAARVDLRRHSRLGARLRHRRPHGSLEHAGARRITPARPAVDASRALAARPSADDRRHEPLHARAPHGARAARRARARRDARRPSRRRRRVG